jgi:hypothetical protein
MATRKPREKKPPIIDEEVLSIAEKQVNNGEMTLSEAIRLFGFQIGTDPNKAKGQSFSLPNNDDGAMTYSTGSVYGTYVDLDNTGRNEIEFITKYREASLHPECASAIDDIVDEAIVDDGTQPIVDIVTDKLKDFTPRFKEMLEQEFQNVLELLNFGEQAFEIFKRWYVDGRLYYHKIIDPEMPSLGIQELRYIDPRRIRKVRHVEKRIDPNIGTEVTDKITEWYVYNDRGLNNSQSTTAIGVKIAPDSICYVHSGLIENANKQVVLSHLHKCLKFLNQLRHIEDAVVIYRLSRAPERRIFYIDVGQMPKKNAEEYMNHIMNKFRNKLVYDNTTGEVRDDKKFLSMMEDFWLPRREGTKGTEIDILPGGENLGVMTDVEYFEMKLYRSLGVPISRLKSEGGFSLGRSVEINRDEDKFYKFVKRLRRRFELLFNDLLSTNLILKGVITRDNWDTIRPKLVYKWAENTYYAEMREAEEFQSKLASLAQAAPFMGMFYSREYLMRKVMKLTDKEMEEMDAQIQREMTLLPQLMALQQQAAMMFQNTQNGLTQQSQFDNSGGM